MSGTFHTGIVGQDFDPAEFVDPKKYVDFFCQATGRRDLVFKKIETITYWK